MELFVVWLDIKRLRCAFSLLAYHNEGISAPGVQTPLVEMISCITTRYQ